MLATGLDPTQPNGKVAVVIPRWEWRTFFSSGMPGELRDQLSPGASPPDKTAETYILSLSSPHTVKVRHGHLTIKLLEATERGLERWRPTLETPFPIDAPAIHAACEALSVPAPVVVRRHATFEEFLHDVVFPVAALKAVRLLKRRTRLEIAGCPAEYAVLEIGGDTWETLAIEHSDPARVLAAIYEIGLGPRPSASYPATLKQITDFTATPVVAAEDGIW